MNITSFLEKISYNNYSSEDKQKAIIDTVLHCYQPQELSSLFQTVTDYRVKQLIELFPEHSGKSLSVLFEVIDYRDLVQRYPSTLSAEITLLEQAIGHSFIHWMDFWCQCEIAAIKKKYSLESLNMPAMALPLEDNLYSGMLVEKIEESPLTVIIPDYSQAMSLSDAITLSNLELFIQGEKWYEMLPLLSLSQTGKHFILLKPSKSGSYPTLVSSARIMDWESHPEWLSYAPQFSNSAWHFCLPKHGYEEFARLQLFQPSSLPVCHSLDEFDTEFKLRLSNKQAVCEVLRLTVSGNNQQKLYFMYLAQKKLISALSQANYKLGSIAIEQPFMFNFYQLNDPKAYFHIGYCELNQDSKITYRGFWSFELMLQAFRHTQFRDYKQAIHVARKNSTPESII